MSGLKRFTAIILSVISIIVFTSCNGNGILVKAPELNVPFETEFKLQAGELEMSGSMKRYGTGVWEMTGETPETLAGLELSYNDDGVTVRLEELQLDVPMENIRDGAVFAQIFKAVDSAAAAGELSCYETEDGKVFSGEFSGGTYSIIFDPETLVPVKIEIPSSGIFAELENFRLLSPAADSGEEASVSESADSSETAPVIMQIQR